VKFCHFCRFISTHIYQS